MSYRCSDKCTKEELLAFKAEVIKWLNEYGIDTAKLDLKAYRSYGGDIRIYTGDYMEITNTKSSFRRIPEDTVKDGSFTTYYGTRGHHTTRYVTPIMMNRDEWDFFRDGVTGEYKNCYDDYHKLEKLKNKIAVLADT